jgi:hypothetical protein
MRFVSLAWGDWGTQPFDLSVGLTEGSGGPLRGERLGNGVVGLRNRIVLNIIARRSTLLSLIVVMAMADCWQHEARAGLTVSLAREIPAPDLDFPTIAPGSSSAPARPISESKRDIRGDGNLAAWPALPGLADTEGTSTPVSGAAGCAVSPAVAVLEVPVREPVEGSFRYLRESILQLPQPAHRELLDPPKRD